MNKKMFCGIECRFSKLTDFWDFFEFSGIEFESNIFYVRDEFVLSKGRRISLPKKFSFEFIKELVEASFVCDRLVLHLYPDDKVSQDICYYSDFTKSDCKMIILIYDCYNVEVYCKNNKWLETLLVNARKTSNTIVTKIYKDTDSRTQMYV